jgi:hypothetical protein
MHSPAKKIINIFIFLFMLSNLFAQSDKIRFNGYGGWAYARTFVDDKYVNKNDYLIGNDNGTYDFTNFAFNIAVFPVDRLTINTQLYWENYPGVEWQVRLNLSFVEYTFSDLFKIRIGKGINPFGIYTEIYDVGTLRPFFFLPQALYGPYTIPRSHLGIGFRGTFMQISNWDLKYNLCLGQMPTNVIVGYLNNTPVIQQYKFNDMIGICVNINNLRYNLKVSLSGIIGDLKVYYNYQYIKDNPLNFIGGEHFSLISSFDYTPGSFSVKSEFLYFGPTGERDLSLDSWYLELSYNFLENFQLCTMYQQFKKFKLSQEFEEFLSNRNYQHKSIGLGLNYWINPYLVLKLNYEYINGNYLAYPLDVLSLSTMAKMSPENPLYKYDENTHFILLGMQFAF